MIRYNIYLHNGNEYFGTEGKTLTIGEDVTTATETDLAIEIANANPLIKPQVALTVLNGLSAALARLLSLGQAVQLKNGNDVMMRIYPDVKLPGPNDNINLSKAQELIPETTEISTDNARALVAAAGIQVRPKVECMPKFTELFEEYKPEVEFDRIIERPRIERKDSSAVDASTGTVDTSTNETPSGDDGLGG